MRHDLTREQWLAEERWQDAAGDSPAIVTPVADVAREQVRWLWPGRLPRGKLVVLDGDPALGKSTLTLDWSARITTGSPWPDGAEIPSPKSVVILSAEDGIGDTIRPRLEAHGADLMRVFVFEAVRAGNCPRPPSIPGDLDLLEGVVHERGAGLVVVDVLAAFLARQVDSYRDQDVRGALMPLAQLATRTGATVVVLRHLSKSGGNNALYRGGGSIGIVGAARAAMLVAPDPDDQSRVVLAMSKSNLARLPDSLAYRLVSDEAYDCARIAWDGTARHRADELLVVGSEEERSERDEAAEFLVSTLEAEGGTMPAKDVIRAADQAGIAKRTLTRARQRAGVSTRRTGFGAGFVWSLPQSGQDHPRSGHSGQDSGHDPGGLDGNGDGPDGDLGAWCSDRPTAGFDRD
jgi:RecA-family ATPase